MYDTITRSSNIQTLNLLSKICLCDYLYVFCFVSHLLSSCMCPHIVLSKTVSFKNLSTSFIYFYSLFISLLYVLLMNNIYT